MIDNEEELEQTRRELVSATNQLSLMKEMQKNSLELFRDRIQIWVSIANDSNLEEIGQAIDHQFAEQQRANPSTTDQETQSVSYAETVDIAIETIPLISIDHETQIDPIETIDEEVQTQSLQQLWSMVRHRKTNDHRSRFVLFSG
jgi:tRNA U34 5-carboxymethylaminomethyl modifying GTPase MnmE/TrmE